MGFVISVVVLLFSFLIANAIPFFGPLTGLLGALIQPLVCWIIPIVFFIQATIKAKEQNNNNIDINHTYELKSLMPLKPLEIQNWEYPVFAFIFLFSALITILGTYSNAYMIFQKWHTYGYPFSCLCQNIWNTCACSATRTGMICPVS